MDIFFQIKELLKDYDINVVFARSSKDTYKDDFLSSFYIMRYNIRVNNVVFKIDGENYIISKFENFVNNNLFEELPDLLRNIRITIKYNNILKNLVEQIPADILTATAKYENSNIVDGCIEIDELNNIANSFISKIVDSNFFEQLDIYQKELNTLKILLDAVVKDSKFNIDDVNNLKSYYLSKKDYLINYKTNLIPIYNEIDKADQLIYVLFKKIRSYGITTCDADLYVDHYNKKDFCLLNHQKEALSDSKYKTIHIFKDNSILFETIDNEFIEIRDNDHIEQLKIEIMLKVIKNEFKKYPTIQEMFNGYLQIKNTHLNRLMIIANLYKKNSVVLKGNGFNLIDEMLIYKKTIIKDIDDYEYLFIINKKIRKIVKDHKVKQFAYSIASKKYKSLYNPKIMKLMEDIYDLKVKASVLQDYIGNHIAAYHDSDSFYCSLKMLYGHLSKFEKNEILKKSSALNTKIIYDFDDILIYEIQSFEESNALGAASWCISRDNMYFKSYTKNDSKQYFAYNFNDNTPDNENLIGFTVSNGLIKSACYRNNKTVNFLNKNVQKIVDIIKSY